MKGVVIDYIEDKGFGFIKDENGDKRFFHISNVFEKNEYLSNLKDFVYSDYKEYYGIKCYVLNFTPGENDKGLIALNIELTDQVLNDKSSTEIFEAKVTDVKNDIDTLIYTVQGVKKGMSPPPFATAGGHGTYRIGYPEVTREFNISFRRIDDIGWGTIEVRDLVLEINGREKITDKFVEALKNHLAGKITKVSSDGTGWILMDPAVLNIL